MGLSLRSLRMYTLHHTNMVQYAHIERLTIGKKMQGAAERFSLCFFCPLPRNGENRRTSRSMHAQCLERSL
jgi:hypothetical protein